MKTKCLILLGVGIFLGSCGSQNRVVKIEYDFNTKMATMKGQEVDSRATKETTIAFRDAFVREDDLVSVVTKNYNPYNDVLKVQKGADVLYYMGSESKIMMGYLGTVMPETGATATQENGVSDKSLKKTACPSGTIKKNEDDLVKKIQLFDKFYVKVKRLNAIIERNKSAAQISKEQYYCELNNAMRAVVLEIFPTSSIAACTGNAQIFSASDEIEKVTKWLDDFQSGISDDIKNLKTQVSKIDKNCLSKLPTVKQTLAKADAFNAELSPKLIMQIDQVFSELKAVNALVFEISHGNFKVGETDAFVLNLEAAKKTGTDKSTYLIADLPVRKWMKIDFSAGMFYSWLYDQGYTKTVQTITDDTTDPPTTTSLYTLKTSDSGGSSYGAIGFVNFHTQLGGIFNYGLSLGTGLRFNDSAKLVIAPTVSVFIGKSQRLVVHAGAAISQVDRIHSIYGSEPYTNSDYVPETKQKLRSALLFGVSWNLSRAK